MIAEKAFPVLLSDLDCAGHTLLRCKVLHASNLVEQDNIALTDQRTMLPGSVTDDSVMAPPVQPPPWSPDAPGPPLPPEELRIDQSKLNLNGNLPLNWVSSSGDTRGDADHGVRGDLYQPVSEKAAINGYASLDSQKRIPSTQINLAGSGTLKELFFKTPAELVFIPPAVPVAGVLSFSGQWTAAPGMSWFGSGLDDSINPRFYIGKVPLSLMPALPASQIASGLMFPTVLPVAKGVGTGHAQGAVPDPGKTGDPSDYLGRDMKWHAMTKLTTYQPTLKSPVLTVIGYGSSPAPGGGDGKGAEFAKVNISISEKDCALMYRLPGMTLFAPFTSPVPLFAGETVEAYAVKVGYNDSTVVTYTNDYSIVASSPPL